MTTTIHRETLHGEGLSPIAKPLIIVEEPSSGTSIPCANKWLVIAPLIEQAVPVSNVAAKLGYLLL